MIGVSQSSITIPQWQSDTITIYFSKDEGNVTFNASDVNFNESLASSHYITVVNVNPSSSVSWKGSFSATPTSITAPNFIKLTINLTNQTSVDPPPNATQFKIYIANPPTGSLTFFILTVQPSTQNGLGAKIIGIGSQPIYKTVSSASSNSGFARTNQQKVILEPSGSRYIFFYTAPSVLYPALGETIQYTIIDSSYNFVASSEFATSPQQNGNFSGSAFDVTVVYNYMGGASLTPRFAIATILNSSTIRIDIYNYNSTNLTFSNVGTWTITPSASSPESISIKASGSTKSDLYISFTTWNTSTLSQIEVWHFNPDNQSSPNFVGAITTPNQAFASLYDSNGTPVIVYDGYNTPTFVSVLSPNSIGTPFNTSGNYNTFTVRGTVRPSDGHILLPAITPDLKLSFVEISPITSPNIVSESTISSNAYNSAVALYDATSSTIVVVGVASSLDNITVYKYTTSWSLKARVNLFTNAYQNQLHGVSYDGTNVAFTYEATNNQIVLSNISTSGTTIVQPTNSITVPKQVNQSFSVSFIIYPTFVYPNNNPTDPFPNNVGINFNSSLYAPNGFANVNYSVSYSPAPPFASGFSRANPTLVTATFTITAINNTNVTHDFIEIVLGEQRADSNVPAKVYFGFVVTFV